MKMERIFGLIMAILATAHLLIASLWKSSSGFHEVSRIVIDLLMIAIGLFFFSRTRRTRQQTLAEGQIKDGR